MAIDDDDLRGNINISCFPAFSTGSPLTSISYCSVHDSRLEQLFLSWSAIQCVFDKYHRHTFRHASCATMRTLLQNNDMSSNDAQRYLSRVIERRNLCVAASVPPPSRKVALGVLNRIFNDMFIVDHFYLDQVRIFHKMDFYSIFSAAYIGHYGTLNATSLAFEAAWDAWVRPPKAFEGDQAFVGDEFQKYLQYNGISLRPVPSNFITKTHWGPNIKL